MVLSRSICMSNYVRACVRACLSLCLSASIFASVSLFLTLPPPSLPVPVLSPFLPAVQM